MLLGEMKLTHYFYTKSAMLYVSCATMAEAYTAYKEKFGIDWTIDKSFVMFKTIMPNWDFNWCMAE